MTDASNSPTHAAKRVLEVDDMVAGAEPDI
jgi:hypothetical protein